MKKIRQISYLNILLLLFIAGSIGGCVIANLLSGELLRQIGYFESVQAGDYGLGMDGKKRLWVYILRRRAMEFGIGSLAGMTPLAALMFGGISFAGGFGCSLMISMFTLYDGWLGIFSFLRIVFPQWFFYFAVWVILAVGADNGLEKMKIRSWLLLLALVVAGTVAEAWF